MASYNFSRNIIFPNASSNEGMPATFDAFFRLIKKYNLTEVNKDYVEYYKLTFKKPYTASTGRGNYTFKENENLLYVKIIDKVLPTNPFKILGLFTDNVLEESEITLAGNSRVLIDELLVNEILQTTEISKITPPKSKINNRALNERYKNDLINSISIIATRYGIEHSCNELKNKNTNKEKLVNLKSIQEFEESFNKVKVYNDPFQAETVKVINEKIENLKRYYSTDFEVLKQLEHIANTAKREGILNQIKISKEDLDKNNIRLIPNAFNSLDSYIEQTAELLELYKNKYELASENRKKQLEAEEAINKEEKVASFDSIPEEIKILNQFVIWKTNKNKKSKNIINPFTGWFGSTNDETCWCDYNTALNAVNKYNAEGIGIVLSKGLMGIDINNMYDNNGDIIPIVKSLIEELNSYTEYSPSKKGVHILCYAQQPTERSKFGKNIRWYSNDHFFVLTGLPYENSNLKLTPKEVAQPIIDKYHSKFMLDRANGFTEIDPNDKWEFSISNMPLICNLKTDGLTVNKNQVNSYGYNDEEVMIELRMKSDDIDFYYPTKSDLANYQALLTNGKEDEFLNLWKIKNNLWTPYYQNESDSWEKAVLYFLQMVRLYTDDRNQMDRIFRQSYLMKSKFDELKGEKTYGRALIEQILMRFKSPLDRK